MKLRPYSAFARAALLLWALGALCASSFANRATTLRQEFLDVRSTRVFVAAHRGDWRNAPENSLDGLEKCIAMGVDIVEIDLARTKDGELVLMHDRTVNRTTTGKGKVEDLTLAEIRALRLRNGAGHATTHPIPLFRDYMLEAKGRILVNLDKSYEYWPQVRRILDETGTLDDVIMKGDVEAELAEKTIGKDLERVIFMPVVDLARPRMLSGYESTKIARAYELVFADDRQFEAKEVVRLRDGPGRIWVNSLWPELCGGHDDDRAEHSTGETYDWLLARRVTIIQTDRPAMLLAYLRKRGRHD